MALSPFANDENQDQATTETPVIAQPSRTYEIDFITGDLTGRIIDEREAVHQFILKALYTARFRFLIYDDQYGNELEDLVNADVSKEYIETEIPRLIREALIYDDRVSDVINFVITRQKDELHVEFQVVLIDGAVLDERLVV